MSDKNKNNISEISYSFYSGGAKGADTEWEKGIKEIHGATITVYRPEDIAKLDGDEAQRVEREYREVLEEIERPYYGADTYTGRLMRRDMLQVRNADAVFAIARLAQNGYVDGGTGYSTTRAILNGTPVWLYDQNNGKWMRWDNEKMSFRENFPTALTPRACLVGSRDLRENGRTAMQNIIKRTIDMAEKEIQKENQQENIMRKEPLSKEGWIATGQHYSIEEGKWKTETNLQNDILYHDIQEALEPKVTDANRTLMQDWNVDALKLTLKEEDGSVNATIVYTLKDLPSEALEGCDIVIDCEKKSMNILTGRALNLAADIERKRNRAMTPEEKRLSRKQIRMQKYLNSLINENIGSLRQNFKEPLIIEENGVADKQCENLTSILEGVQVMRMTKERDTKVIKLKRTDGTTEYTILVAPESELQEMTRKTNPDLTVNSDNRYITAETEKVRSIVTRNNEIKVMNKVISEPHTTYRQKEDERYTMERKFKIFNPYTGREGWYADKFADEGDVMTDINDFLSKENSEYIREQFLEKDKTRAVVEIARPEGRKNEEIIRIAHCLTREFKEGDFSGKADIVINAETGKKEVLTVKGEKFIIERAENTLLKDEMEFIRETLPLGQSTLRQTNNPVQSETKKEEKVQTVNATPSEEDTKIQEEQKREDTVQCTGTTKDGRTVTFTLQPNQAKLLSITGVGSEYLQSVEKMSRDGITLNREYTITTDRGEIRIADLKSYHSEQSKEEKNIQEQKEEFQETKQEISKKTENTTNGETQIINQQNSTTMAEKESAAKAAEQNAQKEIYGSVYKNDEYTNKNGETVALAIPFYQITLDMDKIKGMEPGKDGNIYLSIKERKNAGELAKENKPTCFITENTYFKDKRVDLYSKCDIVIKKADLEKIQKNDGYGEKAYILVGSNGDVVPMKSKYEGEAVEIEGRAYHVDPVERQITLAKRMDSKFDISKAVGNAWLIPGKEGKADFFNIAMQSDKIKMLPIDEKNKLHFAIHELKERMNDKAPTHIIVPEHEFATGKIDIYSVKDFEVAKVSLTDQRVIKNEEITVENKTFKRNVTYLQVTSDNKVMINYSKYPELCEKRKDGSTKHTFTLYGAEAHDVDIEARKAEIERRKELAAKKEGEAQEKTAAQEKKEEPTVKKEAKKTVKAKKSKGMGM